MNRSNILNKIGRFNIFKYFIKKSYWHLFTQFCKLCLCIIVALVLTLSFYEIIAQCFGIDDLSFISFYKSNFENEFMKNYLTFIIPTQLLFMVALMFGLAKLTYKYNEDKMIELYHIV